MRQAFTELLLKLQNSSSHISPSAYDTAWAAWLYPEAREWLVNAQHPDGSWGAEVIYYHDRVISTLSAMNALAATSTNSHELKQVERGIRYLEKAIPCLSTDLRDTIAFELLLPSLFTIGQNLGLDLSRIEPLIEAEKPLYYEKLALIPPQMIYSPKTVVPYSLEFIGFEKFDAGAIPQLRSKNGSIHNSPSATVFVEVATGGSERGKVYLDGLMRKYHGTMPGFTPMNLFEIIWSLYLFSLNIDLKTLRPTIDPLVQLILDDWSEQGIGVAKYMLPDPDDTALAIKIFNDLGIQSDLSVLESYEFGDHFQCFPLERDLSLDVHTHIVEALKGALDFPRRDDMLLKALNILGRDLTTNFIVDKWHVSPYYSTSHAIICLTGLSDNIIQKQIAWILKTQRADGSWTAYPECPEAAVEETAHALLALMVVHERTGKIPIEVIDRGYDYLESHYTSPEALPALWINKGLYNAYHIVEAVILATLTKYHSLQRQKPMVSWA